MSVLIKLNSREVALDHCMQKLEAAKVTLLYTAHAFIGAKISSYVL